MENVLLSAPTLDLIGRFRSDLPKTLSRKELIGMHVYMILQDRGVIHPSGLIIQEHNNFDEEPMTTNLHSLFQRSQKPWILDFSSMKSRVADYYELEELVSFIETKLQTMYGCKPMTASAIRASIKEAMDWLEKADQRIAALASSYLPGSTFKRLQYGRLSMDELKLFIRQFFIEIRDLCERFMPKLVARMEQDGVINYAI